MEIELVLQVKLITLPESWPQRMAKLVSWYIEANYLANCAATKDELLRYVPDFSLRYLDMDLDCL